MSRLPNTTRGNSTVDVKNSRTKMEVAILLSPKPAKKHGKCSFAAELDTGRHIVPQTAKLCRDLYI